MSRFIPVEPEKWGEMVLALSEVTRLRAENARLKAEVERLNDAIIRGAITPDAKPE